MTNPQDDENHPYQPGLGQPPNDPQAGYGQFGQPSGGYPQPYPMHGQQPGYPPTGPPVWYPRPTNGMAVASMVLGILWIYWIGSILALIFGYVARKQIRERGESGNGMAVAGIVLGWIGVGFLCVALVIGLIGVIGASAAGTG